MKITALLLGAILFIGVVSSTRLVIGTYTDDKCTQLAAGTEIETLDFKSGQCVSGAITSLSYSVKGDQILAWYVLINEFIYKC